MRVTFFRDVFAREKEERELTLAQLADLITATKAPSKRQLPLLKLSTFGDDRTTDGSLRHDGNVLQVLGLECDYDGERMPFSVAVDAVRSAGLTALFYTSPSCTAERPRWRAIFPFAADVGIAGRAALADRANGIFGGVLARETWVVSQAFFFGCVDPKNFQVVLLDGITIDAAEIAGIPYDAKKAKPAPAASSIDDLPKRVKDAIKSGDPLKFGMGNDRSRLVYYVACCLVRAGWDDERIADLLIDPEWPISAHARDQRGPRVYALRQAKSARDDVANDWVRNAAGAIIANDQTNIARALDELGARFTWNLFVGRGYVNGVGPLRELDDHEVNELRLAVDRTHKFRPDKDFFYDYIDHATHLNQVHPVREFLDSVQTEWDGVRRIGQNGIPNQPGWLTTYGGAEDTPLYREISRLSLVAAVRRVRRPGCKFDEMLVLVNPTQGTDKSTALAVLAVEEDWFNDNLPLHARDKEVIEQTAGRWIIECAELNGMRQSEVEGLKSFLSRQVDRARMAYGRLAMSAPRQWIPVGTTNAEVFLRDSQNRRFWPVRVGRFDIAALRRDVHQLWAEAATIEASGASIRLDEKYWPSAAEAQADHRQEEPWVAVVHEALVNPHTGDAIDGRVMANDVWKVIGKPVHQRTQVDNYRLGEAMKELGFRRMKQRLDGHLMWCYVRGDGERVLRAVKNADTGAVTLESVEELSPRELYGPGADDDVPF